jgi:predicted CXXCH cytochrome family protein
MMRRTPVWIGVVASAYLSALAQNAAPIPGPASGRGQAGNPGQTSDFLGSESCKSCHEDQYSSWKKSLHVQMTRPVEEARVLGDFGPGTRLEKYGRSYTMDTRNGRRFVKIATRRPRPERPFDLAPGRPEPVEGRGAGVPNASQTASTRERASLDDEEFEVHYTLGARRFQGYLSRLPQGRIYVLPVFWHVETGQWIDFKEITPLPPEGKEAAHDFRQIWNVNCFNCHATNLTQNFDTSTKAYSTTWTEMGIGCEACHGPGREHTDRMRAWKAGKIERPSSAEIRGDPWLKIVSPRTAAPRQIFDTCGYCHGNKTNYFPGFRAGDRYEDFALPFLISQPIPPEDPQGDFWPDGRPNRFNRPQAITATGCFLKGNVTCTSCHVGHAARNDHALKLPVEQSNGLCTQCHSGFDGTKVTNHTRHAADSAGSRCVECHMSDVNWRLLTRRRDHTFAPPVPEMTAQYGVPNACTTCHDDKTPEWAVKTMDAWYGEANRVRRSGVMRRADAMYRAGARDRTAIPALASLLAEPAQGVVVRASAADFIGRLSAEGGLPIEAANALLKATADREPMVRATAIRALGFAGERRAVPAITARLRDPVRVVRVTAASALLGLGVATLEGQSGVSLVRAQDEYAESLRAFPDASDNHTSLGWLEMSRGRDADADRAIRTAIDLNPSDARARLLRGVLLARQDKLDDAIREWTEAKKLDPSNPRIDLLIEEARRRKQ